MKQRHKSKGAVTYNVSDALANRHHTRIAREGKGMIVADGSGSDRMVESKSKRIVSMRNYLCPGNGASGDFLTASAPIWVSLC